MVLPQRHRIAGNAAVVEYKSEESGKSSRNCICKRLISKCF